MSASVANIAGVTDPFPSRAGHGEFPLSAIAGTHREAEPFMIAGVGEGAQAEPRRERGRLKLLLELAGEAVSNHQLRDLVRAMMMSIRRAIDADRVCIFLKSPNGDQLEVYALDFPPEAGSFKEGTPISLAGTITSHVFQTGKPWAGTREQAGEVFSRQLLFAERFSTGCMLPLSGRNRVVGTLGLARAEYNPYSKDELDFLTRVTSQIALTVENVLAHREITELKDKLAKEKVYLEEEIRSELNFDQIVGHSPAIKQVLQLVETVAPSDSTILLLGETGTGKELIARAIHDHSRRKGRTFVKLNCAAIPTGLLESELFGHERGAFTGAISQRVGRLELADQGTLFLDEVGDVPLEIQPKLLRALQEREFERLGSTRTKKVDVRLVAATNRDLESMIAAREFRSDLYYRLNVFPIRIPPLRERRDDIAVLARYFVQKCARQMQKQIETIPVAALKAMTECAWPGNVRELANFIERAVILTRGKALEVPIAELENSGVGMAVNRVSGSGREEIVRIVRETMSEMDRGVLRSAAKEIDERQREEIERVLGTTKGRVGGAEGAAARLGIKRTTLLFRMRKLGIDPKLFSLPSDPDCNPATAQHACDLVPAY
ncbi:MAG TPA: sigma 54-interacting transcriptional regulator [Blastocatellia bacterium]|nr:sigma 54-interacting transcriptional regulator [Blastocatellia bacterium]